MSRRPRLCALAMVAFSALTSSDAAVQKNAPPPLRSRTVAILVYEGAALIDFAGPQDVLSHAGGMRLIDGRPAFEVFTVAPGPGEVKAGGGPRIVPDYTLRNAPPADIVVIPGGPHEALLQDKEFMAGLEALLKGAEIRMSVCNGAFILGSLNYLDGIEATSSVNEGLRRRFPRARVLDGVRVVDAGSVITTGFGATGIDGALVIVARLLGRDLADMVAHHMDYPWRPPSADQPGAQAPAAHTHAMPATTRVQRLFAGAVEKIQSEGDPAGALTWLRRCFDAGYETPSDALREPAFAPIRTDPAQRRDLRELLAAHCRESDIAMVADNEPGQRLLLELECVDSATGRPLPNVRVFVFQTDDQGDYAPEATRPGGGDENARLFAFVRTDDQGRASISTVLPGPYRESRIARHVHMRVDREGGAGAYGTAIYFDTDPAPDEEIRRDAARGRVIVAPLEAMGKAHRARATIRVPAA